MGLKKLGLLAVIVAVSVGLAAAAASAATSSSQASNALVFGAASDPVIIDGPLVSDGESLRVDRPDLRGPRRPEAGNDTARAARSRRAGSRRARTGSTWTFTLRKGVKFHGRHAVQRRSGLLNFNRWYNFPGPLQNAP